MKEKQETTANHVVEAKNEKLQKTPASRTDRMRFQINIQQMWIH